MTDFTNIDYLKTGDFTQQMAYKALTENQILHYLQNFDPLLVGTVPLAIAIENSDLDIICHWKAKEEFIAAIQLHFGNFNRFFLKEFEVKGMPTVLANFHTADFEIEIFGQNIPSRQQLGYRHMTVENALLLDRGEDFKSRIIALKKQGYKTEPAFAKLLAIEGDPYQGLLDYEYLVDLK